MLIIIVLIALIFIYIWFNPTVALIPYNNFISLITDKKVFYSNLEKQEIFPESKLFEKYHKNIKKEALNVFNLIKGNVGKEFIQQKDEFWKGWNTFPLRMFGQDISANLKLCPTLSKLLSECDEVVTAFFSMMDPGKKLDSHYGPFKGILRYHLGLAIPKDRNNCYIYVDGIKYCWEEEKGILFDETYKHFVHNDTDEYRIILFLDIKRPLSPILSTVNDLILNVIGLSPHNQKVVKRYKQQLLNQIC